MKKKTYTILIPNAGSPQNVGDFVIVEQLIELLTREFPGAQIIMHCSNMSLYEKKKGVILRESIVFWSLFKNTNIVVRLFRVFRVGISFVLTLLRIPVVFDKRTKELFSDFTEADQIVFVGGGYLRSQKGTRQTLNVLMQLCVIYAISFFPQKKLMACISVGPFAYNWQEWLTCCVLKKIQHILLRETHSYHLLEKHGLQNIHLTTDLALLGPILMSSKKRGDLVGFTIRPWMKKEKEAQFVLAFTDALARFAKKHKLCVKPIVQVHAPFYGDRDAKLTKHVVSKLRAHDVPVFPIVYVAKSKNPYYPYADLSLLLGMRMHSNIIAARCRVPFVAISYEYKTDGIASQLGMSQYAISVEDVTENTLFRLLMKAFHNKDTLKRKIFQTITRLQKKETRFITNLLSMNI